VAVASQTAGKAPSRSAAASTLRQSKQNASVRAALLKYLRETGLGPGGAPVNLVNPGKPVSSSSMIRAQGTAPQPGIAQAGNFQVSGYEDFATPGTFSGVSGTWRVARTSCTNEQELYTMYVGFDGVGTKAAEEVGTIAYCFEGEATYLTWWEIYPNPTVTVSSTIRPGDLVTATVTRTGTSYTLSLTDATDSAQSFSVTQDCSTCQARDAEWITGRPILPEGVAPLAPFRWHVTNAWQTSNGVTGGIAVGPDPTEITMMDVTGTYPLDSVGDLYRNGSSFSAHFLDSY
jgi:Peptidase A4 family